MTGPEAPETSFDIRGMFREAGGFTHAGPPPPAGPPRRQIRWIETEPTQIDADPAEILAAIDGVQAELLISWRPSPDSAGHRPVVLHYAAAAAITPDCGFASQIHERLEICCSYLDANWAAELSSAGNGIPVETLNVHFPWDVATARTERLDTLRRDLEAAAYHDVRAPQPGQVVIADGRLDPGRPRTGFAGVIKEVAATVYIDDSRIPTISGWRSPIFMFPTTQQNTADIYTAYVRLHSVPDRGGEWNHGVIRIETYDPELIDPLAAACLRDRQHPGSGDWRWDRQIRTVHQVEQILKARIPDVFRLR